MSRPKGSKNKPRTEGVPIPAPRVPKTQAGPGHNSGAMDDDQYRAILMDATVKAEGVLAKIASLTGGLRAIYKAAKADGIEKKYIDFSIKLRKQDPETVRADSMRRARITEWLHPGVQAELFGDDPTVPASRAYEDGKQAGAEGKDPIAPAHFSSQASDWLSGWHAGQAINVSGIQEIGEEDAAWENAGFSEDPLQDVAE